MGRPRAGGTGRPRPRRGCRTAAPAGTSRPSTSPCRRRSPARRAPTAAGCRGGRAASARGGTARSCWCRSSPTSRPDENDLPSPRQITARSSGRVAQLGEDLEQLRVHVVVERVVLVGVVVGDRGDRARRSPDAPCRPWICVWLFLQGWRGHRAASRRPSGRTGSARRSRSRGSHSSSTAAMSSWVARWNRCRVRRPFVEVANRPPDRRRDHHCAPRAPAVRDRRASGWWSRG